MTYATAKAAREALQEQTRIAGDRLKAIPGVGSGPMGLTPDHVKNSPDYKDARLTYDRAFEAERRYNALFVKMYKREIQADRKARRASPIDDVNENVRVAVRLVPRA